MSSGGQLTLQINLCAGDLAYAAQSVRALVHTHREDVAEVLVVADACRPHSTAVVHAPTRFGGAEFAARVAQLRKLCDRLAAEKLSDRTVWVEPDPAALRALNAKYAGVPTARSHDHLGHAFSAYFLGWEAARTRYVLHCDADVLLWQQPTFRWTAAAIAALQADETLLAASPRIAPPPSADVMVHVNAPGSGWLPTWPLVRAAGGWRSPWFSTRCHLIDRERLHAQLPLASVRGTAADRRAAALDRLFAPVYASGLLARRNGWVGARLAQRVPAFPLPPEVLLHEHAQTRGFSCLYLDDPRAWFIHPDTKPTQFLRLLPRLLAAVSERGEYPPEQRGISGVQFAAWEAFAG